jgi:hypothetical protein
MMIEANPDASSSDATRSQQSSRFDRPRPPTEFMDFDFGLEMQHEAGDCPFLGERGIGLPGLGRHQLPQTKAQKPRGHKGGDKCVHFDHCCCRIGTLSTPARMLLVTASLPAHLTFEDAIGVAK